MQPGNSRQQQQQRHADMMTSAASPNPNQVFAEERDGRIGTFLLGKTIGSGSFGKVKKAIHEPTGVQVAIKIINKEKISAKKMDHKVRREIFNLSRFRHPHIIKLYQVIETAQDIYLVMEYVDGGELFDYIVQRGKLPEAEARLYFQQMISAVAYCHSLHVVHRDLKPENLLCATNKRGEGNDTSAPLASSSSGAAASGGQFSIKIADFGLSNLVQDGEFLKTSCGSPNYAAPEVIEGKYYSGEEVDVWSSGVILYALLTARLPFDDDYIPHLFQKIKKGKFKMPAFLSSACQDLIRQMLVVDPLKRITVPEIVQHPWFVQNLPPSLLPYCQAVLGGMGADGGLGYAPPPTTWDHRILYELQQRLPKVYGQQSTEQLISQLQLEDEQFQQHQLATDANSGNSVSSGAHPLTDCAQPTSLLVSYYLLYDARGYADEIIPTIGGGTSSSIVDEHTPHFSYTQSGQSPLSVGYDVGTGGSSDAAVAALMGTSPPLNLREEPLLSTGKHLALPQGGAGVGNSGGSWWSNLGAAILAGASPRPQTATTHLDTKESSPAQWTLGIPMQNAAQRKLQPQRIMTELCRVLKQLEFEWKPVAQDNPYQLRCRKPSRFAHALQPPTPSSDVSLHPPPRSQSMAAVGAIATPASSSVPTAHSAQRLSLPAARPSASQLPLPNTWAGDDAAWIKIGIQLFKVNSTLHPAKGHHNHGAMSSASGHHRTASVPASSSATPSYYYLLDFKLISGDVLVVLHDCAHIMAALTPLLQAS